MIDSNPLKLNDERDITKVTDDTALATFNDEAVTDDQRIEILNRLPSLTEALHEEGRVCHGNLIVDGLVIVYYEMIDDDFMRETDDEGICPGDWTKATDKAYKNAGHMAGMYQLGDLDYQQAVDNYFGYGETEGRVAYQCRPRAVVHWHGGDVVERMAKVFVASSGDACELIVRHFDLDNAAHVALLDRLKEFDWDLEDHDLPDGTLYSARAPPPA